MRAFGAFLIVAAALGLAPGTAAQQKKFKDEALQQFLVPELAAIQSKLDKLAERLSALEAGISKLQQRQDDLVADQRSTQSLLKATDNSVTSLRVSSQQDVLGLKTDITQMRRDISDMSDLLRKSASPPPPNTGTTNPPVSTPAADGYITQVTDNGVTISVGSSTGVKVGMRFNVFRAAEPQSNIGVVEVVDVLDANNSRAKIISSKPNVRFEFSDIVRPL
jgi:plasmid maintenance system killer protein